MGKTLVSTPSVALNDGQKTMDSVSGKGEPRTASTLPRRFPLPDWVLLIVGILVAWEMLHLLIGVDTLPSPADTLRELRRLMADPDFPESAATTGLAFAWALVIAVFGGLGLGVLLGARRLAGEVAEPILTALYSVPKITLYPVILLIFGLGLSAKVVFGAIHGIIPVIIITMNAVRHIRPVYIRTARSLRLSPRQAVMYVLIPATIPEVISGLRIGFALTLLGTLIGEMFASSNGIGFMLTKAMGLVETRTIMALGLLLFIFATAINVVLLAIEKWFYHRTP